MKCHYLLLVFCLLKLINAEAELKAVEELTAEHRSAKPEPFLDRLAAFFTGGSVDKKQSTAASVQRPVAVLPPRPPLPPARPNNIPLRKQSYKPAPVYQGQSVAPSNNFQTFVQPGPGKTLKICEKIFFFIF